MTTTKNYWARLCEFLVRGGKFNPPSPQPSPPHVGPAVEREKLPSRPVMDVDENDRVLASLGEGDPAYRVLMNYAYVHVENNLTTAFDVTRSVDDQRDFKNRAAGVAAFISDVELTRARLREEILAKQKLDAKKKR